MNFVVFIAENHSVGDSNDCLASNGLDDENLNSNNQNMPGHSAHDLIIELLSLQSSSRNGIRIMSLVMVP